MVASIAAEVGSVCYGDPLFCSCFDMKRNLQFLWIDNPSAYTREAAPWVLNGVLYLSQLRSKVPARDAARLGVRNNGTGCSELIGNDNEADHETKYATRS